MARNKYGNKRVTDDNITFDSKAEHRRYLELKMLQKAGVISRLSVHPKYVLIPAFTDNTGKKWTPMRYIADFSYYEDGVECVEDVKGVRTQTFNIKYKLFVWRFPHIQFRILYV